ncbi:mucin-2-like isoform X10 [Macrosteles quadrilineatus]|uniref:mucin-2-like isoform X10 n=1 Tax=Macrosteles quadrilineatus TaxID=74068 RepID=UPI0023E30719|nr:mucin-2-like isoform X10 [Macrosteles quadrilineatus]
METMFSQRGKTLKVYDGYKFRRTSMTNQGVAWRCVQKNCVARLYTDESENVLLQVFNDHNHEKTDKIEREKFCNTVKIKATTDLTEKPSELIRKDLTATGTTSDCLTEKDIILARRALYRVRRCTRARSPGAVADINEGLSPTFISANQEVDGQLDGKSTSLSATKAKKLSKKVETQNPGADGGPSTSASVPQFPIPDFSASSTISDLNLSEPSTSADNSQSTPLEPSASVSGTGYTPSESPPIQVPELYESRMYISPTPMLFEEDMPASQDADGESGPTQTTSVADATPEPTESTSTVKVKPIETLQSKDMFGRESEQATENETAKVDISVKSLESAIKRLESVSNKLAATSNFDSYDQFGKYISSVLRGLPKKKVVSLKQKIITEVMQALSQEEGSGAKNTQTSKNRADTDSISKNCANNTPVITLPTVSQPTFGGPVMYAQLLPQVFEPQVPFSTNVANPSIVNVMTANTFKPPDIATIQPSPIISESLGGQTPFSTSQRSRGRPRKRSGPPETYTNKKMAPDDRTALTMASEMKTTSVNPDFTMAPEMNTTSVNSADELNMYQLSSGSQQESHSQDRLQESPQVGEMEGTTNVENLNSSQLEYEIDIEEGNELAKIKLDSNDSFETVLCEGSSGLYIKEEPPEPDSLTTSQAVTSPVNCHLCSERLMSREHLQEHFCSAHSGVNQSQGT